MEIVASAYNSCRWSLKDWASMVWKFKALSRPQPCFYSLEISSQILATSPNTWSSWCLELHLKEAKLKRHQNLTMSGCFWIYECCSKSNIGDLQSIHFYRLRPLPSVGLDIRDVSDQVELVLMCCLQALLKDLRRSYFSFKVLSNWLIIIY